jgi:hypothetical protein
MEIWTSRTTSANPGLYLMFHFCVTLLLLGSYRFVLQAAYFVRDGFKRRDKRSNMLLVILLFWVLIL